MTRELAFTALIAGAFALVVFCAMGWRRRSLAWEAKANHWLARSNEHEADADFWATECNRLYLVNGAYSSIRLTDRQARRVFRKIFPAKHPSAVSYSSVDALLADCGYRE